MAEVKKIRLPDNTVVDINDSRVSGVDSHPVSGSGNVITSGGVKEAISSLNGGNLVYTGEDGDVVVVNGDTLDTCLKGLDDQILILQEDKQNNLISGTNIKTVDGNSLMGSGNVSTKTPVASSMPATGFLPNVFYNLGELSGDTTFLMAAATDNTILNHWYWVFDTPATAPTITWPAAITSWQGGSEPAVAASTHYEISVINGVAAYMEV